jgi:Nif-specific regulatory protein
MKDDKTTECVSCLWVKELEILLEISKTMASVAELPVKLSDSMKLVKKYLHLEKPTVYKFDQAKNELIVFASNELTLKQRMLATYKVGEGATGIAYESKEPIVIEDIHKSVIFLNKTGARDMTHLSYIAVPMIAGDNAVGVISADLTKGAAIGLEETVKILTIIGSMFAHAILVQERFESEKQVIKEQKEYYKTEVESKHDFGNIVGESSKMKQLFDMIKKVAVSKATVLVRGETGTGKELIASAIHKQSPRRDGAFIKLNCGAIPENLLESELFGHEKGAFTDAKEMRKGRFELADNGTLFLDEIGDISPALQVKLLRVLQEQEFERVGGSKTIKTDVRVIAATNRNLEEMVEMGEFREDLFYRLNVIPLFLPPLRERDEDIVLLANHLLEKFAKSHKKTMTLSHEALIALVKYPWPGNIRELENTMERAVLLIDTDYVDEASMRMLLPKLRKEEGRVILATVEEPRQPVHHDEYSKILTKNDLLDMERDTILEALKECGWVQAKAAKKLGLTTRQIGYKIKKYEIELS